MLSNDLKQKIQKEINIYEFNETLPGSKRLINFKPTKTKMLKKLLMFEKSKDPAEIENVLDDLITDSVVNEDFDINELMIQDRIFLLMAIRIRSKGSSYDTETTCKKCKSQFKSKISFAKIKIKELPAEYEKSLKIQKDVEVIVDHITRKQQKEIFDLLAEKDLTENEKYAEIAILSYAQSMQSIKINNEITENLTLEDKEWLLENTGEQLLNKIKEWHEKNDFGIDLTFERKCPHCGNKEKIEISPDTFF